MNNLRILSFFLFVCIILSSCGIKTKFNQKELAWLNVYNTGDTIIFKSSTGELDTSVIVKKEIYYPEYNPVEVHDQYLPQTGTIWYKNKHLINQPDRAQLLYMIKKRPGDDLGAYFDYLEGGFIVEDMTKGTLEKFKKGKVYEFDCYDPRSKPWEPKMIYWHEDHGIIKYITHGGIEWNRINIAASSKLKE